MTRLLYGLALLSSDSLGLEMRAHLMPDELAGLDLAACRERARKWLETWQTDADVLRDPRVIVPVGSSGDGDVFWATLGVKVYKSSAKFVEGYEPSVLSTTSCQAGAFVGHDYYLLVEEMAEIRLRRAATPPTREELRRICDEQKTREAIVAALEAL